MTSIAQILRESIDPFDAVNFRPGNFWHESPNLELTVDSIHRSEIEQIVEVFDRICFDRQTRTILLCGDSGAGKSHLLARLKQRLNHQAFFVYIGSWVDRDFLWRHILKNTIDSLLEVPQGELESQLLIWLKGLSIFKPPKLRDELLGDRQLFIQKIRNRYPTNLYHAREFFGILYDLLDREKFSIASNWLKGEYLDERDLARLQVRRTIDTEDAAQKILVNFSRLSIDTLPIVLCFDNLDCISGESKGEKNLQYLLNFNSTIHNEKIKNFLIIFSLITHTARLSISRMQPSDLARVDRQITLKPISLPQAELLYQHRLSPLHERANPKPESSIFPLNRATLAQSFPGGKTNIRNALEIGRRLVFNYKTGHLIYSEEIIAAFRVVWWQTFDKMQVRITRVRQFSSIELIRMLKQVFFALNIKVDSQGNFFPDRYTSSTIRYDFQNLKIGLMWIDEPNLTYFCHTMEVACEVFERGGCDSLVLIRSAGLGRKIDRGYQLYEQIFTQKKHTHLIPSLESICCLATYKNLLSATLAGNLVVGDQKITLQGLRQLVRESQVWQNFPLLQDLKIIPQIVNDSRRFELARVFAIDLIKKQQLIGRKLLINKIIARFPQFDRLTLDRLIERICEDRQIQILDPDAAPDEQLICIISS
ncbi:MAG: ATP-binding protein [Cyanobacteriota bacterium]|nr:ATP-binding protein [Cyanobacteriota bacterium]